MTPRDAKSLLTTEGLTTGLPTPAERDHLQSMTDGVRSTVNKARTDEAPQAAVDALAKAQEELERLEANVEMSKRNVQATTIQHSFILPKSVITPQTYNDMKDHRRKQEAEEWVAGLAAQGLSQDQIKQMAKSKRDKELAKARRVFSQSTRQLNQPREITNETINLKGDEHFHTKRGRLFEGDKPPSHRLPKNLPNMHQDDGQPRRICDILSATPWAVQTWRTPGFYTFKTDILTGTNIDTAARILKERMTVVFGDEVADELRWSGATCLEAWTGTPGAMPPFSELWVEARTGAAKTKDDFIAIAATGHTIDLQNPQHTTQSGYALGTTQRIMEEMHDATKQRVRAVICVTTWIQCHDGTVWGPISDVVYFLDHDFRVITTDDPSRHWKSEKLAAANRIHDTDGSPFKTVPLIAAIPLSGIPDYLPGPGAEPGSQGNTHLNAATILAASTFCRTCGLMNASNVRYIEGGRTNQATSEKKRAQHRLSWVKYHVLRLKVGTQLRSIAPAQHQGDRPNPLSMVRGHFKHYGMNHPQTGNWCAPFLGKHLNRTHWCPSFVRGTAEDGVVTKDYEQTTPETTPAPQESPAP